MAPMSTPRVGWPISNTVGARPSSRANTSFCWLPPENLALASRGSRGRTSKRSIMSAVWACMACRCIQPQAVALSGQASYPSAADSQASNPITRARAWRSSGTWANPSWRAWVGCSQAVGPNVWPFRPRWPDCGAVRPDNTSSNSLCPLPDTPATPTISPARSCRSTPLRRGTPQASVRCRPCAASRTSPGWCTGATSGAIRWTARPTMAWASASTWVSATGVSCTTVPARITVTWSHRAITSFSLWVMRMTVLPCARKRRNTSNSWAISWGVSTAVGSSRMRVLAPRNRAFKISTRWRSPTGRSPTGVSSATCRPVACIRSCRRWRAAGAALCNQADDSAPSITLSSAVMVSTSMKCWWTMPSPRAMASCALRMRTGWPSMRSVPLSAS